MSEVIKVKQPFVRALRLLEKARAEIKRTGHADYCASWGNSLCDCDWPEFEKELDDFLLSQWSKDNE